MHTTQNPLNKRLILELHNISLRLVLPFSLLVFMHALLLCCMRVEPHMHHSGSPCIALLPHARRSIGRAHGLHANAYAVQTVLAPRD